ncbi:MAG TPA: hypothetical protein VIL23_05065 [Clostridia bacterium]
MAKENKKAKIIGNIIWISLVAIIAALAITAGLIKSKAAVALDKPYSIQIISQGGLKTPTKHLELSQENAYSEELEKLYKTYQDASDFSELRGILENQWFKKAHISTYEDKDGKQQLKTLSKDELLAIKASPSSSANASKYLIAFRYLGKDETKKTLTIDGVEIVYDTVFFTVRHTQNEIASFKMYFVEYDKLENEEFYKTYEITAYAQLTKIYTLIQEILEK